MHALWEVAPNTVTCFQFAQLDFFHYHVNCRRIWVLAGGGDADVFFLRVFVFFSFGKFCAFCFFFAFSWAFSLAIFDFLLEEFFIIEKFLSLPSISRRVPKFYQFLIFCFSWSIKCFFVCKMEIFPSRAEYFWVLSSGKV